MRATPDETIENRLRDGAAIAPVSVDYRNRKVHFVDLDGVECREPFFHETLKRIGLERPDAYLGEVALDRFLEAAPRDRAAPDAIIFHTGRCGSTLVANMLTASGRYSVLREPRTLIDLSLAWLEAEDAGSRRELETLVEISMPLLLAATAGAARYRVLKTAAWNVQLAGSLLRMFPSTPAVFVYRTPFDTVASMLFEAPGWVGWTNLPRPMQVRYLPSLRALAPEAELSRAALFAHAWRSAVEAALAVARERLLLLDYASIVSDPGGSLSQVLAHLGHAEEDEHISAMLAVRSIYSKDVSGTARFDPAGSHRRPPLTPEENTTVDAIAGDVWRNLGARTGKGAGA